MPGATGSSPNRLSIWHIGARDGYIPIAFPSFLDRWTDLILIDAAAQETPARVELADGRIPSGSPRRVHACVAGDDTPRTFEVRACPYASGMYRLSDDFAEWSVFGNGQCDYVLGAAHATTRIERFTPTTVDKLSLELGSLEPSILVVDAQGASREILLDGARGVLAKLDAVVAEVELLPFYGEIASFAQLLPGLWGFGFAFAGFLEETESWATPARVPVGQRCETLPGSKDAMFIRIPQRLDWGGDFARLARYVVSCTMFGHVDFGLSVLRGVSDAPDCEAAPLDSPVSFALDLWHAQRGDPCVFPPVWSPRTIESGISSGVVAAELHRLADCAPTRVESVLLRYGFGTVMKSLQARRIAQARVLLGGRSS